MEVVVIQFMGAWILALLIITQAQHQMMEVVRIRSYSICTVSAVLGNAGKLSLIRLR